MRLTQWRIEFDCNDPSTGTFRGYTCHAAIEAIMDTGLLWADFSRVTPAKIKFNDDSTEFALSRKPFDCSHCQVAESSWTNLSLLMGPMEGRRLIAWLAESGWEIDAWDENFPIPNGISFYQKDNELR